MAEIKTPKKLIEVALPLEDINVAAAREKSIRHGHSSTLHLWWARRPLAVARAVLFAQMVNDPGYQQGEGFKHGVNKKKAEIEREKLFQIIRDLVKWENTNNEEVLNRAREAIWESWRETCHLNRNHPQATELFNPDKLPAFHDPFAGGGAIPLEAQRLGLESYASDLNPIPVIINKAMIEIPPKFAGRAPVGPIPVDERQREMTEDWTGTKGLAEDVRRYSDWMRNEAIKRIGHLYPKVKITDEMAKRRADLQSFCGTELTVIAWLWARTVQSPNPAFSNVYVPLAATYILSGKKGKEAYLVPKIDGSDYWFEVKLGKPPMEAKTGTKSTGRGANFLCILSGSTISGDYLKAEGQAGRMGQRLMAVVLDTPKGRRYISPTDEMTTTALSAKPGYRPEGDLPARLSGGTCVPYGLKEWGDLFTDRQLIALTTLSDLAIESRAKVKRDAQAIHKNDDELSLSKGGAGTAAYAEAISIYLSFQIDQLANHLSTLCAWHVNNQQLKNTFARQSLPMTWDFAETNPLSTSTGSLYNLKERQVKGFASINPTSPGLAYQMDAQTQNYSIEKVISTDPPYYDNIYYADLSDFFYVWLRRSLKDVYPEMFGTMATPKSEELVANPLRHGNKEQAEKYFLDGMTDAMRRIAEQAHPAFPVTIYYAFKQSESGEAGTGNTGWETFLAAVINAGFSICGTWPVRTEQTAAMKTGVNALASSIVLVCQKRSSLRSSLSRREFQRDLREKMPDALEAMIGGETGTTPIAPVDLAQAAIGPGVAIYSKYEAVLNQDGSQMSVHDALILINRAITEYLSPESGSFDSDTQFCSSWFDQYGWSMGPFGEADTLTRAKGTSVDGVSEAGVVESGGGKVRLLKWAEYDSDWDPTTDNRTPIWEACHQMIRSLNNQGESAAGELLAKMPERGEPIRQLAYHLYTLCERKKWAEDARAYNELIGSWHAIVTASHEVGHSGSQAELGLDF